MRCFNRKKCRSLHIPCRNGIRCNKQLECQFGHPSGLKENGKNILLIDGNYVRSLWKEGGLWYHHTGTPTDCFQAFFDFWFEFTNITFHEIVIRDVPMDTKICENLHTILSKEEKESHIAMQVYENQDLIELYINFSLDIQRCAEEYSNTVVLSSCKSLKRSLILAKQKNPSVYLCTDKEHNIEIDLLFDSNLYLNDLIPRPKQRCIYGKSCSLLDRPKHMQLFYHPCPAERLCILDNCELVHPCPFAELCQNHNEDHRTRYIHPRSEIKICTRKCPIVQIHPMTNEKEQHMIDFKHPCPFGKKCTDLSEEHVRYFTHPCPYTTPCPSQRDPDFTFQHLALFHHCQDHLTARSVIKQKSRESYSRPIQAKNTLSTMFDMRDIINRNHFLYHY